jgi:hypothetical protein
LNQCIFHPLEIDTESLLPRRSGTLSAAAPQRLGSKSARDQVLSEDRSRLAKNCREEYALRKKPQLSSVSDDEFAQVVRLAPLVSIDLVTRNANGHVLVGLRNNEPAKGVYFVPGGRIHN